MTRGPVNDNCQRRGEREQRPSCRWRVEGWPLSFVSRHPSRCPCAPRAGWPWRLSARGRVAGEHCCSPAPSERHVNLSVYAAQASPKAPCGTRWDASAPPARYGSGADGRNPPGTAPAASCCPRLCPPSPLFRRSRAETPKGSQPAFAEGDLARRLNPYPSHYGAALASSLLLYPPPHRRRLAAGLPRREDDGLTTIHR